MTETTAATATTRHATTRYPINALLRGRWSSRAYAATPVPTAVLGSLFEAARWAPSAGNGQPWSFLVADSARDPEGYAQALAALNESNQTWVRHAPILLFAVTRRVRDAGREHYRAQYYLGLAVENLVMQASDLGLIVRQMAGFNAEAARDLYAIPEGQDPIVAIAIGYPGPPTNLSAELQEREAAPRERKPLEAFVFAGRFGQAYEMTNEK